MQTTNLAILILKAKRKFIQKKNILCYICSKIQIDSAPKKQNEDKHKKQKIYFKFIAV